MRLLVLAYATALLAAHYYFPLFPSPNELSRVYLLEAVVHDRSLAIDGPIERGGDLEDKVVFAGNTYSNKPPGLALLALPTYAFGHLAAHLIGAELGPSASLYVARLGAVTLPAILWAWLFVRRLERRGQVGVWATALVAAVLFGTGLLPYGAQLMAHATTTALLGAAALTLLRAAERAGDPFRPHLVAAALCSAAVACEYPVAVPATALLGVSLLIDRSPRALAAAALGIAPAALVVLGYNALCFGNPFDLGYGHHVEPGFAELHGGSLLGGFKLPGPADLVGLTVAPSKGLFAWSPFLLLAAAAAVKLVRDGRARVAALLSVPALALFLFIASYPNWHGGWTVGPRYLLPLVPLLCLLMAEIDLRSLPQTGLVPALAAGLAATAITLHALPVLTWPYLPERLANPWFDLSLPLLLTGDLSSSASALVGLPAAVGLVVVTVAILCALGTALQPRPASGAILCFALLAVLSTVERVGPQPDFFRAEVLFRKGSLAAAAREFDGVLEKRHPSPAMTRHIQERLAQIRAAD